MYLEAESGEANHHFKSQPVYPILEQGHKQQT